MPIRTYERLICSLLSMGEVIQRKVFFKFKALMQHFDLRVGLINYPEKYNMLGYRKGAKSD